MNLPAKRTLGELVAGELLASATSAFRRRRPRVAANQELVFSQFAPGDLEVQAVADSMHVHQPALRLRVGSDDPFIRPGATAATRRSGGRGAIRGVGVLAERRKAGRREHRDGQN